MTILIPCNQEQDITLRAYIHLERGSVLRMINTAVNDLPQMTYVYENDKWYVEEEI